MADLLHIFSHLRATANPVEVVWLLAGVFCLYIDWRMLRDLYRDKRRLHDDAMNGGDDILIVTYIGMNWVLVAVHVGIAGIGAAFALREPINPDQPVTTGSLILTFFLVLIAVAAAFGSVWLRYRRNLIRSYLLNRFRTLTQLSAETPIHVIREIAAEARNNIDTIA